MQPAASTTPQTPKSPPHHYHHYYYYWWSTTATHYYYSPPLNPLYFTRTMEAPLAAAAQTHPEPDPQFDTMTGTLQTEGRLALPLWVAMNLWLRNPVRRRWAADPRLRIPVCEWNILSCYSVVVVYALLFITRSESSETVKKIFAWKFDK